MSNNLKKNSPSESTLLRFDHAESSITRKTSIYMLQSSFFLPKML